MMSAVLSLREMMFVNRITACSAETECTLLFTFSVSFVASAELFASVPAGVCARFRGFCKSSFVDARRLSTRSYCDVLSYEVSR